MSRPLVIIESPYAADTTVGIAANRTYARAAVADSLARGEAPFASHLLYTQPGVLDDTDPQQRHHGIAAGLDIAARADLTAVYTDRGISPGMRQGLRHALHHGRPIQYRTIGDPA